jgi:hypothetical protein
VFACPAVSKIREKYIPADLLKYCIIGGLAVNAYAEPVVSLDLDVIVTVGDIENVCTAAVESGLRVEEFEQSINLISSKSDLRLQIQKDPRYQDFIHERFLATS